MPVSSPDLKAFLLATPFFGGLSDASLDLLVSMLAERSFDAGATIFAEGEPGRSMFVVHSGDLVVSKLGDSGRSIRMTDLGPGDFFGEMTLIETGALLASVDFNMFKIGCTATRAAMRHLRNEPLPEKIMLPAEIIDKTNYKAWLMPVDQRVCPDWAEIAR